MDERNKIILTLAGLLVVAVVVATMLGLSKFDSDFVPIYRPTLQPLQEKAPVTPDPFEQLVICAPAGTAV